MSGEVQLIEYIKRIGVKCPRKLNLKNKRKI